MSTNKPLQGITVLEFSQFLSGPAAGLRLSDLGAKVIKIEKFFQFVLLVDQFL